MSEIIAKAMNSTLGTSNFKGFDEILLSEKCLIPSTTEVIATIPGGQIWTIKEDVNVISFEMPVGGSVNVGYTVTSASTSEAHEISAWVNGTRQIIASATASDSSTTRYLTVVGNRGDEVVIKRKGGSGWVTDLRGKLITCKPFNVTKL